MELLALKIKGYRRFEDVSVRLREPFIALVGQNEAGKSSFLAALEELNNTEEIRRDDQTRGLSIDTEIEALFEITPRSRSKIEHLEDHEAIEQVSLTKHENGEIIAGLSDRPSHDFAPRGEMKKDLATIKDVSYIDNEVSIDDLDLFLDQASELLSSEKVELPEEELGVLETLKEQIRSVVNNYDPEEYEEEKQVKYSEDVKQLNNIVGDLDELYEREINCPAREARRILKENRPEFMTFGRDERNLQSTYDLTEINIRDPPSELANLANLADLDIRQLYDNIDEYEPDVDAALRDANRQLERIFSEIWVTKEVVPYLSSDDYLLHIHVQKEDEGGLSRIGERSDGLAWFVALRAFLEGKGLDDPILLVDEIETHLSYDAQARLIDFIESEAQQIVQQVIYTTHSAGALPTDIGRGIRPVERLEGKGERSDIHNGFWMNQEPGFSPLLLAMGLSPFAFALPRNAIVTEGPSDCVLLPELLRKASGREDLGYQIAPGASYVDTETVSSLLSESASTLFLFDGDDQGDTRKSMFEEAGVPPNLMRTHSDFSGYQEDVILEDFVNTETFLEHVNREIDAWQARPEEGINESDIDPDNLWGSIEDWCVDRELDVPRKIGVAQRIVESSLDSDDLIGQEMGDALRDIDDWAAQHFDLDP